MRTDVTEKLGKENTKRQKVEIFVIVKLMINL